MSYNEMDITSIGVMDKEKSLIDKWNWQST